MTSSKGRCYGKGDFSCVEVLDDLIVGKTRCPAMLVMERDHGVIRSGMLKDKIDEKAKLIPAGQQRPGILFDSALTFGLVLG